MKYSFVRYIFRFVRSPVSILFLSIVSSRRLQDMSSRHLQDMSSRRLQDMSSRRLQDVFSVTIFRLPRRLQDVFKTSSRRLQNVLEDVKLLRWRRVEDVFKTNKCLLGRLPRNRGEFILRRVECAGGKCNVFTFLNPLTTNVLSYRNQLLISRANQLTGF